MCLYKDIFLSMCVLQIEVSEVYFVPDAGASSDQCEAQLFKPVSTFGIQTESFVNLRMFSFKTHLTFYDTFSTIPLERTSFPVGNVTRTIKSRLILIIYDTYLNLP